MKKIVFLLVFVLSLHSICKAQESVKIIYELLESQKIAQWIKDTDKSKYELLYPLAASPYIVDKCDRSALSYAAAFTACMKKYLDKYALPTHNPWYGHYHELVNRYEHSFKPIKWRGEQHILFKCNAEIFEIVMCAEKQQKEIEAVEILLEEDFKNTYGSYLAEYKENNRLSISLN